MTIANAWRATNGGFPVLGMYGYRKKALLEQIPLRRLGKAEDIAHTVVFLASSRASYISGQVIGVCGGLNR
jgi:3-oxoacyl-[acyl-carrier protein] reductase